MAQEHTPQQGSQTDVKSNAIGSSIDPNVIMPTSQKKSTLRSALQQAEGQSKNKKVAPVMVRSYTKDVQTAMERGKNIKDAKNIKKSLVDEKKQDVSPAESLGKKSVDVPKKNVPIPPKKKETTAHVPIPTKDLSGAPKKTLTFSSEPSTKPEKPKAAIPKAPAPPYKNKKTIKDQLLDTEKKEKDSTHIEVHKEIEEQNKSREDNIQKATPPVTVEETRKQEIKDVLEDSKDSKQNQTKDGEVKDVPKKIDSSEKNTKEAQVPFPIPPKKEVSSDSMSQPVVQVPEPAKDEKKEEKVNVQNAPKKDNTPDIPKKQESRPEMKTEPTTISSVDIKEKKQTNLDQEQDPFESVLFGGSVPPAAPKEEMPKPELVQENTPKEMPKKPVQDPEKNIESVIKPKEQNGQDKKPSVVPVGMEEKKVVEKDIVLAEQSKEETTASVPVKEGAVQEFEPKKEIIPEVKKEELQKPQEHKREEEEEIVVEKREETKSAESSHRMEDHISSEQLRAFKNDLTRIDQDIALLEAQQKSAATRKDRIVREKKDFEQKLQEARQVLDIVIEKEESFENAIHELEKEELSIVDPKKRHSVEEKRWVQEDLRATVEKEKWDVQELYSKIQKAIEEKNNDLDRAESSYTEFARRIAQLTKEKNDKKYKVKLGEVEEKKREIENIQVALLEEKRRLERLHATLEDDEKKYVSQRKKAEGDEKQATTFSDKRSFEESRRLAEKSQREVEQKRWEAEESLEKVLEKIQKSNEHYTTVSKIEDEIRERLK